jgi:hypothetical protein
MRWPVGLLILAGCTATPERVVVEVPVTRWVPIPSELTAPCVIADGDLRDVIEVARQRKESLKRCNQQLRAIENIRGAE